MSRTASKSVRRESRDNHRTPQFVNRSQLGAFAVSLLGFVTLIGCDKSPSAPSTASTDVASLEVPADDLVQGVELLAKLDHVDQSVIQSDALFFLNRWIASQPEDEKWKPDELLQRLPRRLRETLTFDSLKETKIDAADLFYLRESLWLRDVSEWVSQQPSPAEFSAWLEKHDPPLPRDAIAQLKMVERLFDWTVRNIQLDELLPPPKEQAAGPSANAAGEAKLGLPPAALGAPGPGYRYQPWQTLLFGHGDAWQRARVFALLARQQGIEMVMLGVDDPATSLPAKPWLPAAVVHGQLYLWDTSLGLPIPTKVRGGIATLEQVIAEPELLDELKIEGGPDYPVGKEQLANIVAMIDANTESLAKRMRIIERKLPSKYRMTLTVDLSDLASRVKSLTGVKQVVPWGVPFEAELYSDAVADMVRRNPQKLFPELAENQLFFGRHPMVLGRIQHLRGAFDDKDDLIGAKSQYLKTRFPDTAIENLATNPTLQREFGLVRHERESDEAWQRRLAAVQLVCREAKNRASYWLGLVHFEQGNFTVAADWLGERYLKREPNGVWVSGAKYNLARCYEALGEKSKARDLYAEPSPQKIGNGIRASKL